MFFDSQDRQCLFIGEPFRADVDDRFGASHSVNPRGVDADAFDTGEAQNQLTGH